MRAIKQTALQRFLRLLQMALHEVAANRPFVTRVLFVAV